MLANMIISLGEQLGEILQYSFMRRALLTSLLVGGINGILSCFIVLKRWSLLGDAISHAVLPGVALSHIMGWPFFIGAFFTGALTSLGISFIERNSLLKEDAAMGIMFTGAFALGIVIISRLTTSTHLMHILFGNVLGVQRSVLILTIISSLITVSILLLYYKEFQLYSFDPVQAEALGMNTKILHYGLMLILTLTIVASLETVGIILVIALLVIPGATAYLICDTLPTMMLLASGQGMFSAASGLFLAYKFNLASGGAIVLVCTLIFWLVFLFAPKRGFLTSSRG